MDVEDLVTPRTYKARVVIQAPTAVQVREALDALETRAPAHAVISFNPWTTPNDRYYVVATWMEALAEDGS